MVGALLQIVSTRESEAGAISRCNMAGWCVDTDYRGYAHPLHARAIGRRDVVYFTVTPAPHTLTTLAAVGYRRYSEGQVIFAPLLSRGERDAHVVEYAPDRPEAAPLSESDARLLADHSALGCYRLHRSLRKRGAAAGLPAAARSGASSSPASISSIAARQATSRASARPTAAASPATAACSSSPTPSAPSPASPGVISPSASRVTTRVRRPPRPATSPTASW